MEYEEKLQKLRDAGVIDMELSFGCDIVVKNQWDGGFEIIEYAVADRVRHGDSCSDMRDDTLYETVLIKKGYTGKELYSLNNIKNKKILGHDLLYGRVCRWIEKERDSSSYMKSKDTILPYLALCNVKSELDDLWHRKDLPLSQQENKEEIVDFICSLLSSK